jgi:hypothetical protein
VSNARRRQPEGEQETGSGEARERANVESRETGLLVEGKRRGLRAWEGQERRERLRGQSVAHALERFVVSVWSIQAASNANTTVP